jgi:hypothetical protein
VPKKESIWVRGALEVDQFNDPLPDVDQPDWREIPGCVCVPRSAGDFEQRGPIIISGWLVKAPGQAVIQDTDAVKIRGKEYEIEGSVGDYTKAKIFYTMAVNAGSTP